MFVTYTIQNYMKRKRSIGWKSNGRIPELSQTEIDSIDIEIESREGLLAGNLGNMKTKMEGNIIYFLVGTIHSKTYAEDC